MATPEVYEYVAATIVKSVTEKHPSTAGSGQAHYDSARGAMTRDDNRQYVMEARNENGRIEFRYGEFHDDPNVQFGSWHPLPSEHSGEALRHLLNPGQTTMTITVRYTQLDEFL
jgi:hypothetical protein